MATDTATDGKWDDPADDGGDVAFVGPLHRGCGRICLRRSLARLFESPDALAVVAEVGGEYGGGHPTRIFPATRPN